MACDNKVALFTFAKNGKRVPAVESKADVQRVLREVKIKSSCKHRLKHVKGHQDDYKRKSQLSLATNLNTRCDKMEKSAVIMSSHKLSFPEQTKQKLPLEAASLFIGNEKITTDPGRALRHKIGKSKARKFYMERGIMNAETFNLVAWEPSGMP